jgi:hypothetical protein
MRTVGETSAVGAPTAVSLSTIVGAVWPAGAAAFPTQRRVASSGGSPAAGVGGTFGTWRIVTSSCPCTNDGVCDALNERCDCADCQTESFCDDGGLGGGGLGGGSAGAGGSGGASGGPSSAGGSGL